MNYADRMDLRGRVLRATRRFFEENRFVEVDTPVALSAPAPEPSIEAPRVQLTPNQPRYLQTSPELPMKRLLSLGFERIFQITPAFRFSDYGAIHRPEFRILEWYRRNDDWLALQRDCEKLLIACSEAAGTMRVETPFVRVTVDEAFQEFAGFSILECLDRKSLAARTKQSTSEDSWNDLFHRIFLNEVEPMLLREDRPVFLTHYPAPLASLARLSPEDSRVAERFELYFAGMELANGFGELVDPAVQRRRFEEDRMLRLRAGLADYPEDERFFEALATLPPCAGIAMGFDRLVLAFLGGNNLDDAAFLPWDET